MAGCIGCFVMRHRLQICASVNDGGTDCKSAPAVRLTLVKLFEPLIKQDYTKSQTHTYTTKK